MQTERSKVPAGILALHFVFFAAAWTAAELLLVPRLEEVLSPVTFVLVRDVVLKCLIWLLPALLLIRRYGGSLTVRPRALFRAPKSWRLCLEVLALFAFCLAAGNLVRNRGLTVTPGFGPEDVVWMLFVGLTEETLFRGWLLNALWEPRDLERTAPPWKPVALTSILFLLIHFPIWIRTGAFVANLTGGAFLSILVLSVVFSWTFWKTRSLAVPIVLHSAWDLMVTLLA